MLQAVVFGSQLGNELFIGCTKEHQNVAKHYSSRKTFLTRAVHIRLRACEMVTFIKSSWFHYIRISFLQKLF